MQTMYYFGLSRLTDEVSMRLLSLLALLPICFVCSPGNAGSKSAGVQPDISRSGRDFLEICSAVDSDQKGDPVRIQNDAACLGWVEGFRDGFTVHDELLGVPRRDRIVCIPGEVTSVQIVRVIKKYLADNPDKAHRATRLVASVALASAFSCKARKS
jgi:Rap1a immunity proteins